MTLAIFYRPEDATKLAAEVQNATTAATLNATIPSGTDTLANGTVVDYGIAAGMNARTLAGRIWNGGLSGWATAPTAPVEYQEGDNQTRIITVTAQMPGNVTVRLGHLAGLLAFIAVRLGPGHEFAWAIGDDMLHTAVDPWPPA